MSAVTEEIGKLDGVTGVEVELVDEELELSALLAAGVVRCPGWRCPAHIVSLLPVAAGGNGRWRSRGVRPG